MQGEGLGLGEELEGRTFSVMTTEQSMQARRLRCWPVGTQLSPMIAVDLSL